MDRRSKYKRNIWLMYMITFLQGIVIYAAISTLYREQRGLALSDYAIIESFSYFFVLIFEVPFGFIADRIGYKKTLVLANGLYFLSKVVFWKANSFFMFLLERLFLSMAFAGISGVDTGILYLSSEQEASQKVFGYYAAFGTAGMLTGSLLFTLLLSEDYTACAFWTMIVYGAAFILTCLLVEVKDRKERVTASLSNMINTIKVTLKDTRFLGFLLAAALLTHASWLISVMLNQDKYLSLGMNGQQIGIIAIAISVAGLFAAGSAFATKKLGFRRFMYGVTLLMSAAALAMGITKLAAVAILCNFLVDFGHGMIVPLINKLENDRVSVADRATQLSIYGMIIDIISIGLSMLTSAFAKVSFEAIFGFAAVELLTAILFVYLCYGKASSIEKHVG